MVSTWALLQNDRARVYPDALGATEDAEVFSISAWRNLLVHRARIRPDTSIVGGILGEDRRSFDGQHAPRNTLSVVLLVV